MNVGLRVAALLLFFAANMAMGGQEFAFNQVGPGAGIGAYLAPEGMGSGAAAADYDNDGDVDFFVPTESGTPDQLYRNNGDGTYTEVAALVGLADTDANRAGLWFDYDGDHDLDLVVARANCEAPCDDTYILLYRQEPDGSFVDVTAAAGLTGVVISYPQMHFGGFAAGDLNRDGFLDLHFGYWSGTCYLLMNNGDGTFTDATAASGICNFAFYWQPVMHDFDGDGWLDILQAIDFEPNKLWINGGDGTYADLAPPSGIDNPMNDMGVALSDYDNDGDLDVYITNVTRVTKDGFRHNVLFRTDSMAPLTFSEVSQDTNCHEGDWGWGATFIDANRDGWPDIAATNGFRFDSWPTDPSRFYLNAGTDPANFIDVSAEVNFDDTQWGSALLAIDSERDGDLDLLQICTDEGAGTIRLLRNDTTDTNHYLVVKPRMSGANHWAIGAIVYVEVGGMTMARVITAGTSFLGQEPAEAFFGLGSATQVDQIRIEWPDGTTTTTGTVAADQVITLTDGGTPIPAVSNWGVIMAALMMMAVATLLYRRTCDGTLVTA
ncbi:MAG: CRTAC1 family protein [Phycisphaerae bacterium]